MTWLARLFKRTLPFFAVLTVGIPLNAAAIKQCDHSPDGIHFHASDYVDHGRGIVSFHLDYHVGWKSGASIFVADCASGKTIKVSTKNCLTSFDTVSGCETQTEYDRSAAVSKALGEILSSDETYTLNEVADALRRPSGDKVSVEISDQENCACAIRYPTFRGGKQVFEMWRLEE